ncbi:trypsin-like serine protease [Jannaschia formosa]|uniref:trypsin-like serine protease n=1 Tax=Jannaschia formosa TaxID=2259592 RepID=UPI001FD74835|nr:trypsin-like serine protease [Jannaschia formosa]
MRTTLAAATVAICAALATAPAQAITINDDDGVAIAAALGDPFNNIATFDLIGTSPFCTGALVSTTAVLTARHCFDGYSPGQIKVQFTEGDGTLLHQRNAASVVHLNPGGGDVYNGSDLTVISFLDPILDLVPFRLVSEVFVGETVRMIGYGAQGLGSTGHNSTYNGTRWGANNILDSIYFPGSGFGSMLETDFDNPAGTSSTLPGSTAMIAGEGTTASGDSGGPLLVQRGSEWVVGGILTGGTTANSVYGDISIWTGLSGAQQRSFVETNSDAEFWAPVPLPAAVWLMLAALGGLTVLRRRRVA